MHDFHLPKLAEMFCLSRIDLYRARDKYVVLTIGTYPNKTSSDR